MALLQLIDENGKFLDRCATEKEVVEKDLLHASVHTIIVNDEGDILCRTIPNDPEKFPFYPGYTSTGIGEHVYCGESFLDVAYKTLRDISVCGNLEYLGNIRVKDEYENEISANYLVKNNKGAENNRKFLSIDEIKEIERTGKITPHLIKIVDQYEQYLDQK